MAVFQISDIPSSYREALLDRPPPMRVRRCRAILLAIASGSELMIDGQGWTILFRHHFTYFPDHQRPFIFGPHSEYDPAVRTKTRISDGFVDGTRDVARHLGRVREIEEVNVPVRCRDDAPNASPAAASLAMSFMRPSVGSRQPGHLGRYRRHRGRLCEEAERRLV